MLDIGYDLHSRNFLSKKQLSSTKENDVNHVC